MASVGKTLNTQISRPGVQSIQQLKTEIGILFAPENERWRGNHPPDPHRRRADTHKLAIIRERGGQRPWPRYGADVTLDILVTQPFTLAVRRTERAPDDTVIIGGDGALGPARELEKPNVRATPELARIATARAAPAPGEAR